MGLLTDKVAIVTGAGQGLGRAVSLEFSDEGSTVALLERNPETLQEAAAFLEYLHTPERLQAFWDATGWIPSNTNFDDSIIADETVRTMWQNWGLSANIPYVANLTPFLFVLPLLALLAFVFGYPLVRIFEFSFKMVRGIDGPWIGVRNYELVLNQPLFWESVTHNLMLLLAIPVMVIVALLISIVLYERVQGWKIYRVVLFLPFVLAVPIIAVVLKKMFQFSGPVNQVLHWLSLDFLALDWIGSTDVALWTVILVIIWRESALGIILFLARLLSLDESLLEAARIEGANWWQRVWYVILPQMKGVIEFFVVVSIITMLAAVFAYIYMIGGGRGGSGTSTWVLELYIFNALIRTSLPGIASAVAVMVFVVSILLIFPLFAARRRAREEEMD